MLVFVVASWGVRLWRYGDGVADGDDDGDGNTEPDSSRGEKMGAIMPAP